ncbi:ankyrin repeat domain-containing protein 11 [Exaiptasia diaphana]|uniref:Uncharacterized protein n=1 Tax=Exaiptasia diaphana TaxID=2652724 RepID=A0A913Y8G7_EXADI|nr:ankyrin repeat domain-containing protein 11 [Exaiptasia diaphana]KXJ21456.1 Acyl-CoA-binding domain-containing protein 6 [Exaiptasia diaphana]
MKKAKTSRKPSTDVVLRQAIEDNDIAQLKFVLRFEKEKINDQDENQMTALHWSCIYGRAEMVGILLDNGADIEKRDSKGWTALHFAANGGYLDVVEMLLASCVEVAATSHDGKVAIDVAQGEGMVFLLATGFIKAGKEDFLLKYFSDSTSSLRSIEENQEENNVYMSQQNLLAAEIWRASQQLLLQDFSTSSHSRASFKMSTSEYGICKNAVNREKESQNEASHDQGKRSTLMPQDQQKVKKGDKFLTLPRKQKLNNFDSAFAPGVLRRLAVSETNLNLPHSLDCNNNENNNMNCAVNTNQPSNYYALNSVDSEAFHTAAESMI